MTREKLNDDFLHLFKYLFGRKTGWHRFMRLPVPTERFVPGWLVSLLEFYIPFCSRLLPVHIRCKSKRNSSYWWLSVLSEPVPAIHRNAFSLRIRQFHPKLSILKVVCFVAEHKTYIIKFYVSCLWTAIFNLINKNKGKAYKIYRRFCLTMFVIGTREHQVGNF